MAPGARKGKIAVVILCTILGLALIAVALLPAIGYQVDRRLIAKMATAVDTAARVSLPDIIADLKRVDANPPFPIWSRERNADPLLSTHVSWSGTGVTPLTTPSHLVMRTLFTEHEHWHTNDHDLQALLDDPRLDNIDTAWLEKLDEFDHWQITTQEPVQSLLQLAPQENGITRIGTISTMPVPNFTELEQWALIYFLKAHRAQKTEVGFKVFRQVATLANSAGCLIGNMVAVSMLAQEHRLAVLTKTSNWPLVSEEVISAYKALSWAWVGLIQLQGFNQFPAELTPYLKPQNGVCGGAIEDVKGIALINDFFEPQAPLEDDFSERLARSRESLSHVLKICGHEDLQPFVSKVPASANPIFERSAWTTFALAGSSDLSDFMWINPARLPYIRRVVGLDILKIVMPNYLRFYENTGNPK